MTISTRTDVLKYSYPRTVVDWNHLDEDIVSAPTVPSFNERLRNHQH